MISINCYTLKITNTSCVHGIEINNLLNSYYINSYIINSSSDRNVVIYYIHNNNLSYAYLLRITDGEYTMIHCASDIVLKYLNSRIIHKEFPSTNDQPE